MPETALNPPPERVAGFLPPGAPDSPAAGSEAIGLIAGECAVSGIVAQSVLECAQHFDGLPSGAATHVEQRGNLTSLVVYSEESGNPDVVAELLRRAILLKDYDGLFSLHWPTHAISHARMALAEAISP